MARKLDHGALHAKAEPEEWDLVLARILNRADLSLNAAIAKAARYKNALAADEELVEICIRILQFLRIDPCDLHLRIVLDAAVIERLRHRHIGIGQRNVLADDGNFYLLCGMVDLKDHLPPCLHVGGVKIHRHFFEDNSVEAFLLHHQRHLVDRRGRAVLDDRIGVNIAEERNFLLHLARDRLLRSADENVGLDPDGAQLLDAVLGRLRLELPRRRDIRKQCHMDVERIILSHFLFDLADRLKEGQALDIADGTADFRDDDVGVIRLCHIVDALLDLVRDMRNDLYRRAEVVTVTLLIQDGCIDLSRCDVRPLRQIDINEALVVTEIEIRLRTIVSDEHLTVLIGAHRAGINIDVRIELLNRHLDAAVLEQSSERSRCNSLAEGRNHAARDEYILCHIMPPPYPISSECFRASSCVLLPS